MACGICGSDLRGMDGSTGRRIPPLIMSHEAYWVIAGVGSNVQTIQPEARVTLITAVVPLAAGDHWFRRLYQKEKGLLKVILEP